MIPLPENLLNLKWYYDQKVTLSFLLYFESMYYRYLSCLILSHDFDEKSDFLNYEFSKRLPAITQFKNGLVQKESWVEGGCDVILSKCKVSFDHSTTLRSLKKGQVTIERRIRSLVFRLTIISSFDIPDVNS